MGLPVCVVDAFADKPFTGNPAAVVFLDGPRDDAWRQSVASEMNLSETAVMAFLSAIVVWSVGLLADMIARLQVSRGPQA